MSSEFKFIKCLEWCTKLPTEDSPIESPTFLLKVCECLFKFTLTKIQYNWYYIVHVKVMNGDSELESCNVELLVGFKNQHELNLAHKTFTMPRDETKEIWCESTDYLKPKIPSDYLDGNWLKFRFCFEDVMDHDMDRKEMEDKCLQTGCYLNTDVSVESLTKDMFKLMDNGVDHDAEIKCGEHSVKAHKNILCARSEVFKAMLQSDSLEGRTGVVEIQDIDLSYIQDFVKYLYTGALPDLNFEKAKGLYEAGDKYAVRSLMLRCSEYLQDNLSPQNALDCLALADAHSDEKLKDSATMYCLEKKLYLNGELWLPFCQSHQKAALEMYIALHEKDSEKNSA